MNLSKYQINESNNWSWHLATYNDIEDIMIFTEQAFESEPDQVITVDRRHYLHNLTQALVTQNFNAAKEQIAIARDKQTNKVVAYSWIGQGSGTLYSTDKTAEGRMAHVDFNLPGRTSVTLVVQILKNWENWAKVCGYDILISTTIRLQQPAYIRLHKELNFTVRGAIAYKRLSDKEPV